MEATVTMTEQTNIGEGSTGDPIQNLDQAKARSYTQEEVDSMMARMRTSLEKKLLKPYQDLGDPDEIRTVMSDYQKRQQDNQLKRGEWEKTLQEVVSKKDAEITKRDAVIKDYKINTPLLAAAAQHNAVNANQVKALLVNSVRLNDDGEVEVVDEQGKPRYSDKGKPVGVEDLVREFLDSNPHFKLANPATTNSKSVIKADANGRIDITKLNMNKAEDRARYKEYRKQVGLNS
jgi:hypothetical protein